MLKTLKAHPSSDLDWEIDPEQEVTWHLDFGWTVLDPFDEALFNANFLAVEEFAKRVPKAKKVVLAICDGQFADFIQVDEPMNLYCVELFSEYLHRLASVLPDETIAEVRVDISKKQNFAEMMLLFCRRRFEHFSLEFSNIHLPIEGDQKIAVSLPQDEKYDIEIFQKLFTDLSDYSFKCIPEELLNEHWEGVDYLIVDPESMGDIGRRMLYGFEAAGGTIISTRGSLGFTNETSLEDFFGVEGFEPPTHCSQSSCASQAALYSDT